MKGDSARLQRTPTQWAWQLTSPDLQVLRQAVTEACAGETDTEGVATVVRVLWAAATARAPEARRAEKRMSAAAAVEGDYVLRGRGRRNEAGTKYEYENSSE